MNVFAILLILGRKLLGGIIYVISNIYYFGSYIYQFVAVPDNVMNTDDLMNVFISLVSLGLSIGILLDLALNQDRHEGKDDKNTHWMKEQIRINIDYKIKRCVSIKTHALFFDNVLRLFLILP